MNDYDENNGDDWYVGDGDGYNMIQYAVAQFDKMQMMMEMMEMMMDIIWYDTVCWHAIW